MFYKEYEPGAALAPCVKCLWVLEKDYQGPFPDHEHLWADANGELIFTFGAPYSIKRAGRKRELVSPFVIGPCTESFDLYSAGITSLVGARFYPWGFFALSETVVAEIVDRVLPANRVVGSDVDALAGSLERATREERVEILRQWLFPRITGPAARRGTTRPIVQRLMADHGATSVARLAREFGTTARRLERLFRRETGMSPKQLSRVVRFNYTKQLIEKSPNIALTELTHLAGYSDQAHFSKSFKEMFGITPGTFKAQIAEALALFADTKPDVAFLQDS